MKNNTNIAIILILMATGLFTGCQEMNSRVEDQLDHINKRAEELDSAVNSGLDKVEDLDSTISAKTEKIRDLDSIVRKTGSRIDSIVTKSTEKVNFIRN
ncbi:hypothetical protein [Salinimicrobium sediminis]|nr:hypothetical protein [Salinimicrobium sediminis]